MARQILRYRAVSIDTITETILYSALPAEDEAQPLPTFTNVPIVKVFPNDDRDVRVIDTTATEFTVKVSSEGDDDLPITITVEIVNRDVATGPTPATDFSTSVLEPLCTPLDMLVKHNKLRPNEISFHQLFNYCLMTREIIDQLSKYYSEGSLQTTPWSSPIIPHSVWQDVDGVSANDYPDLRDDAANQSGFRAIQVSTDKATVFTQMYIITFTSSTTYSITGHIEGGMGNGNINQDFTSGNGDFSIKSGAGYGQFAPGNVYFFSIYKWYARIVQIAINLATANAMWDVYGRDQVDAPSTASSYFNAARNAIKKLQNPDEMDGERLPSLGDRNFSPLALPYDVDFYGRDATRVSSDNKDSSGKRGEMSGLWNFNTDIQDWWN